MNYKHILAMANFTWDEDSSSGFWRNYWRTSAEPIAANAKVEFISDIPDQNGAISRAIDYAKSCDLYFHKVLPVNIPQGTVFVAFLLRSLPTKAALDSYSNGGNSMQNDAKVSLCLGLVFAFFFLMLGLFTPPPFEWLFLILAAAAAIIGVVVALWHRLSASTQLIVIAVFLLVFIIVVIFR